MKYKLVYLLAILYSFVIGLSFLFTKLVVGVATPLEVLTHRFTISFILIQLVVIFSKTKISLKKDIIMEISPLAVLYPILFFLLQAYGIKYISSSESGVLFSVTPIFTMVLAWAFIKEKVNSIQAIGIIMSVSGILYIFFMKGISFENNSALGVILTVMAVLSGSGFNVMTKKLLRKYSILQITYVLLLIGGLIFNIAYIVVNFRTLSVANYFSNFASVEYTFSIFSLGMFASVLSVLISAYCLSKIPASQFSVFSNFSTLISIFTGIIILKEKFYFYHVLGTLFIISGVILTNFGSMILSKLIKYRVNPLHK